MRFTHTRRPGFLLGLIDFFTAGLFFLVYMQLGLQDELDEILGRRTQRYWVAYLLGIPTLFIYTLVWMARIAEELKAVALKLGIEGAHTSFRHMFGWNVFGLVLFGPSVATWRFFRTLNRVEEELNRRERGRTEEAAVSKGGEPEPDRGVPDRRAAELPGDTRPSPQGQKGQKKMFNRHDIRRDACQLYGPQARRGYDWWWHSFTARHAETGEEKPFFIEFFLCNPALGGEEPIFGQTPENKAGRVRPSYLMVKAGAWGTDAAQLHRFFGWNTIRLRGAAPFSIHAEDCALCETETSGSVQITPEEAAAHPEWMCQSGSMSWKLKIDKQVAFNVGYGASGPMRALQAFEMFWHAEGMKTAYEGEVIWNGERYLVDRESSFGYADKNWGRNFTSPWLWISSCHLTSERTGKRLAESVFDIGGGRPKVGPLSLPRKLLSAFWYEGKAYEFNFSKFWTRTRTEFACRETDTSILWHVEQSNRSGQRMITDLRCEKKEMLLVNYEAPDGMKRHNRLWNGGNGLGTVELWEHGRLIDRIRVENAGCEYGEYDA